MKRKTHPATGQPTEDCQNSQKLFKLVASKGGALVFDDRIEASTPREARNKMREALGLRKLAGIVYAITEIPVDLIREIVRAELEGGTKVVGQRFDAFSVVKDEPAPEIKITRYGNRNWAVWKDGEMVAVTVYKKGAKSVAEKIGGGEHVFA